MMSDGDNGFVMGVGFLDRSMFFNGVNQKADMVGWGLRQDAMGEIKNVMAISGLLEHVFNQPLQNLRLGKERTGIQIAL